MKYIIQIYKGEINGHGEKEGLPTEFQFEKEQEMIKTSGYVIANCSSIMLNFSGTRENNLKCKRKDGQIIRIPEVNEHRRAKHTAQDHREHPFP